MRYEPILDVYEVGKSPYPREAYLPLSEHVAIAGGWTVSIMHRSTLDGEIVRQQISIEHFKDLPPDTLVLIGTREVPETELEWQRCAAAASRERIDPGDQV